MFAVDNHLRVNLSGEVRPLVPTLRPARRDADCRPEQLMLRMETLYFPADAVIGQAALFLKDQRGLPDKVGCVFGMVVNRPFGDLCVSAKVMIIVEGRVEVRIPKKSFDGPLLHILKKG
jgi:hypothetical protein